MSKNRTLLYIISILIIVIAGYFTFTFIQNNKYSKQLPEIPDLTGFSSNQKNEIEKANKQANKKASGKNIGKLGMVYYAANDYDRAAQCFDLAITKAPDLWEWNYYRGYLHMELGESEQAARQMKRITEIAPEVWLAWYRLGEIYQQMDSTQLAEDALNRIIDLEEDETYIENTLRSTFYPVQVYAQIIRSKVYSSTNRVDLAEKELVQLSKKFLAFGPVFRQLETFYSEQGKDELSKKYMNRANDLIVFNVPVDTLMDRISLISCSEAYVLKQIDIATYGSDPKWSYELIDQALTNIPNSKYVISKAVRQYMVIGIGKQALPLLEQHYNYFKNDYNELVQVGIRMADAGFKKEAAKYFEQALTLDQKPEQKATLAGLLFQKAGIKNKAVQTMQEVMDDNPENVKIMGDGVFLFVQTGDKEKAKNYFNQLKKLSPADANVKIFEGIMAEETGNINKAIKLFEQAFDANPKNKFVLEHLTDIYYQTEMWHEAINFFRKALETYPNDSKLQMQLGLQLVTCPNESLRNISEGKDYSERAFYNSRFEMLDKISAGRTLALAYYQLNNPQNAQFYINETIKLAAKENVPQSYMQGLRNLSQQFSANN